jgi:multiple sugar transport system substrate-binding protein
MLLKKTFALAALAVIVLGLGGCPEPGNTITFWVMPNAETEAHTAWLDRMKTEFLRREGIVVNYEIVSWGDSWERISNGLATAGGPDVIQLRSSWNAHFAAGDGLLKINLNDYGGADSFESALLASVTYVGAAYGVPWFAETQALICNKELFAEAKAVLPRTLGELENAGKKIVARGGRGSAVALPGINSGELVDVWSGFLYGEGGRYVTEDGTAAAFAGEAGKRAVEAYLGLYVDGLAPKNEIESGAGAAERLFAKGKTAMCFLTAAGLRRVRAENPALDLAAVAPPAGPAGDGTFVRGSNLVIPANSPNKQKASRWIRFLLDEKNITEYALDVCAALPAKKDALQDAAFREGDYPTYAASLERAVPYPALASWTAVESETSNALKLMLLVVRYGKYSPEMIPGVLEKAAAKTSPALAREAEAPQAKQ